jgi:hypothetical protein
MSGAFALPPLLPISAQPIFQAGASSVDPNVTTAQAQVQLAAAQQQIVANSAQQTASAAAATAASNAQIAASLAAEQAAAAKAVVIPLTGQSNSFAPGTAPGTVGSLNDNAAGTGLLSSAGEKNLANLPAAVPTATEPVPPPPPVPLPQNPTNVVLVSPDLGLAPLAFISPDSTAMTITDPNSGIATVDPLGNSAPAIVSSITDVMRSASASATIIASQARTALGLLDPMSNAINIANALSRNADPISNVLTDVSNQLGVGPAQSQANRTAAFVQGAMVSAEGQPLPAGTSVGNDFHDLVAPPPVIPLAPVNSAPVPSVSDSAPFPIQFAPQRSTVHHHGG